MGKYIRGNVDELQALGTLGPLVVISSAFDEQVVDRTLCSSLVATWSLADMTQKLNVGPIMVGIAHSDYTSAEIEAFIENTGSWNEGDKVQSKEVGRRQIRVIGTFPSPSEPGAGLGVATLNEGRPIKTKLNWILVEGRTLRVWAYNLGSAALDTTDPKVRVQGHANLWPR